MTLAVRFSKRDGAPVRLVAADDDAPAAALREIDLQKRFHWTVADLANRCALTPPKCLALRRHLGVEDDPSMAYTFEFGSQRHRRYSDKADKVLREAAQSVDMGMVWKQHGPKRRRAS